MPFISLLTVAQRARTPDERLATSTAFQLVIVTAVVAAAVTILAMTLVLPSQRRGYVELMMLYAAAFVPLSHLDQFFRAILQGRGAILSLNAVRLIQPVCYLLMLLFCLTLGMLDVSAAIVVAIGALTVSLIVGAAVAHPALVRAQAGLYREIAGTGWRFHKANVVLYAASELDKAIVLVFLTTTQTGLFAVAIAMSALGTGVVLQSLGLMLMRDMAAADGEFWPSTGLRRKHACGLCRAAAGQWRSWGGYAVGDPAAIWV